MKRTFSLCLVGFFLLSLMTSPGFSQNAADILEKMIEAQGGRKVLENIKDTTLSASVEAVGVSGTITIYKKEPNKIRQEAEIMGMRITSVFDGEIGWYMGMGSQKPTKYAGKNAEDTKRDAQGYAAILHPEKYGITYVLKGKEKIKGKDYFVLEQTIPGGIKTTQYVDTQAYLVYKIESSSINKKGIAVKDERFLSDYKKVDGVMIPHSLTFPVAGGEPTKFTVTRASINTGLEDSLFQMKK